MANADAVQHTRQYDARMDACSHSEHNDENLMLAYGTGDAAAFDTLYHRHKDTLYRYMHRQLAGASIVDELYQDVWSNVIRHRQQYRDSARFITWLYSIARNRIVDYYRAQSRQSALIEPCDDTDHFADNRQSEPATIAINAELLQRLKELINDLPPPQREAFLLKEEAGLSLQTIAEITGADKETIKSRLRYAMKKLRHQLVSYHE